MNRPIYINIPDTKFNCPGCQMEYNDEKGVFLDRINKNKKGYTRHDCGACGYPIRLTLAYDGSFISY